MKFIPRHFYNNLDYTIDHERKVVILEKSFHEKLLKKQLWGKFGFKKIGGSSIGDVLHTDRFKSEFKAFARMAWIDLPILNKKYVKAGIAIEPKVRDLLLKQKGVNEIKTYDAKKYNYDYFTENPIFGGLPDGLVLPQKIVIEIKTAGIKHKKSWEDNGQPPLGYIKQVELYTYLMGLQKYAIVATFLEDEDYINPETYDIHNRKTKTWFFTLDKSSIEDDMGHVKQWYLEHTKSGISPKFEPTRDAELLEFLACSNEDEWAKLINKWDERGKINWEDF